MKHLFLSNRDYASSGACFEEALRQRGHQCVSAVEHVHQFSYTHSFERWQPEAWNLFLRSQLSWCDVVNFVQSDLPACLGGEYAPKAYWDELEKSCSADVWEVKKKRAVYEGVPRHKGMDSVRQSWLDLIKGMGKKIVVFHGNSYFRQIPDHYLELWDGYADAHVMYEGDLMGLGAPNEHLILPPIPDMLFEMSSQERLGRGAKRLVVGHFPTSPNSKGTHGIMDVMSQFENQLEFRHSELGTGPKFDTYNISDKIGVLRIPWRENMKRMSECDIYIDQIQEFIGDKKFGEWVSAASEAAGLGCIVIANTHSVTKYMKTYGGEPFLFVCNTMGQLDSMIRYLLKQTPEKIRAFQDETRAWARRNHGMTNTGKLIDQLVYEPLFEKELCPA